MNQDLHSRVEQTLNSLNGLQRAEASPFLWSKIKTRLQVSSEYLPQSLAWRLLTALVVVALLNLLTIRHVQDNHVKPNGPEAIAGEYTISLPQTY